MKDVLNNNVLVTDEVWGVWKRTCAFLVVHAVAKASVFPLNEHYGL